MGSQLSELLDFLQTGSDHNLLPWSRQVEAAQQFDMTIPQVEGTALRLGLMPARYARNQNTFTVYDQLRLFQSRVAVIGCGGLGGYVIEELARLGVGTIRAVDPDLFVEHNLNRQILASIKDLGRPKVELAAERVAQINPAVTLVPCHDYYMPGRAGQLLGSAQVVVDALDSIPTRLMLAQSCAQLGIPLVHGAIAGWYGHLCTQYPGENTLQHLYSHSPLQHQQRGIESRLGNPAFTPAVVASLEAAETCKILLGAGVPLRGRWLVINLYDMTFDEIATPLGSTPLPGGCSS